MSSEAFIKQYKYISIFYYDDILTLDTNEYGGYTFVMDFRRYAYSVVELCESKIDELLAVKKEKKEEETQESDDELSEKIEEKVEVVEFVAPALPWYVSWLKPVLEFMGALTKAVADYFAPIFAPIGRVADNLLDLPSNIIDGLISGVSSIYQDARDTGASVATQTVTDINVGSPQWQVDLEAQLMALVTPLKDEFLAQATPDMYEESLVDPNKAATNLNLWRAGIVSTGLANFIFHALLEAGSLGQIEALKDFDSLVTSKMGFQGIVNRATMLPFEKGLLMQAEKHYNMKYQAELPNPSQLIEMVVKEVIPLEDFKTWMTQQGFNEGWSQNIWDAHFIPPSWGQLLQAYYREQITREQLEDLKILVDLDPRYDVIWNSLIEVIPTYGDIVNMRVKEVISQADFRKYLGWLGYDQVWADRIWDAHFIPPSLGDMLTSWRRGEITESRLDELMILVDLDPRFKEIFDTRKYDDPSVTMGRFMFETGAINESRVKEIILRSGYFPQDADSISDFVIRFQERLWRRRYLVSLARGYELNVRTEAELRDEIEAAHYTEGVADWIVKNADLRREIKSEAKAIEAPKALTLGDFKKAYNTDRISEDEFRTGLLFRGYPQDEVNLLITLETDKKVISEAGGRKETLSQNEWLNAWRYGEATEQEVRTELLLRGMELDNIDKLVNTKKKQWDIGT